MRGRIESKIRVQAHCASISGSRAGLLGFVVKCVGPRRFGVSWICPHVRRFVNFCSWFSSGFEGSLNERWHVILVLSTCTAGGSSLDSGVHEVLKSGVLLWSNLLEDFWEQLLELLGFWSAGDREKVLAHGELN